MKPLSTSWGAMILGSWERIKFRLHHLLRFAFLGPALVGLALMNPLDAAEEEHLRLPRPDALPPAKAEDIYQAAQKALADGYAPSRDAIAKNYPGWRRYNAAPYLSDTYGNRYVNNYAYIKAAKAGYQKLKAGHRMPLGAVAVKDSYTVTNKGEVFPVRCSICKNWRRAAAPPQATSGLSRSCPTAAISAIQSAITQKMSPSALPATRSWPRWIIFSFCRRNTRKSSCPAPGYPKAGFSLSPKPIVL